MEEREREQVRNCTPAHRWRRERGNRLGTVHQHTDGGEREGMEEREREQVRNCTPAHRWRRERGNRLGTVHQHTDGGEREGTG